MNARKRRASKHDLAAILARERAQGIDFAPDVVLAPPPAVLPWPVMTAEEREEDERLAQWFLSPPGRAGIPLLTCLEHPNAIMMRLHHSYWRLVYWDDGRDLCGTFRCLFCYPYLTTATAEHPNHLAD